MHFFCAMYLGFFIDSISFTLSGLLIWEILEVILKTEEWITSINNNILDILVGLLGYIMSRHCSWRDKLSFWNEIIFFIKRCHIYLHKIIFKRKNTKENFD